MSAQKDELLRQEISNGLEKFAASRHQKIEDVVSIKLRFMRDEGETAAINHGGQEYRIIDPAIDSFFPGNSHPSVQYNQYESGPEIIGMIADFVGIAGGIYGAWLYMKSKISSGKEAKEAKEANPPFKEASSLSIEIRQKLASGEIYEKRIKLVKMDGDISKSEMQAAFKQALR